VFARLHSTNSAGAHGAPLQRTHSTFIRRGHRPQFRDDYHRPLQSKSPSHNVGATISRPHFEGIPQHRRGGRPRPPEPKLPIRIYGRPMGAPTKKRTPPPRYTRHLPLTGEALNAHTSPVTKSRGDCIGVFFENSQCVTPGEVDAEGVRFCREMLPNSNNCVKFWQQSTQTLFIMIGFAMIEIGGDING